MKTADLLQHLADARGLTSDYQIAKYLGLTRSRVSTYRHGKTIGEELAIRICEDLAIDPSPVLASIAAERANCTEVKRAWEKAAAQLAGALGAALVVGFLAPLEPADVTTNIAFNSTQFIHYAKCAIVALMLFTLWRPRRTIKIM